MLAARPPYVIPTGILAEIAYLLEQDIKQLYFMDPIFNLNAKRAKEICRLIIAQNERRVARGLVPLCRVHEGCVPDRKSVV